MPWCQSPHIVVRFRPNRPDRLKDLVIRTETNKLVTDLVDFDRVQSLLLMISYRRRYLAMRDEARRQKMADQGI